MTPVAALTRLVRVLWPRHATAPAERTIHVRGRRVARSALAWFAAATVLVNVAVLAAADELWPRLRDPEYGRRADHLRQRLAENPGRPLVLVLGSSRVGAGVAPGEWEAIRPGSATDPLLFNMAEVGGGPFIQLMTLRRAY